MNFYNRQLETLDRGDLRKLQDERLRFLAGELATNEFYQAKARQSGVRLERIARVEDLLALPFTTKAELVEEQQSRPPYGRLLTYPLSSYRYFHQTSGTTGRPLRWLDTSESWDWWTRCWGYVYRAAGVSADDVVFCAFSFGPYVSHWTAICGAWHVGAICVSGGGMSSEQRLEAILGNGCTVLVCTPTYALHLAEVARGQGIDLPSSGVRRSIHAGEPGASLPNVKRAIEQSWGATCFDHAGATEVGAWAFDCEAQTGAIHLNEAEFVFEVVDPKSGESVSEGQRGELAVTNLGRGGMPVLRYLTGDLVEMTTERCACGRSFARIKGGVLGRADDMMIVRGVNIYPGAIDDLIRGLPGIVEYEVNVRRMCGMDDLLIKLETPDAIPFEETSRLLLSTFRHQFNIRVSVERAAAGSLPRYEFKARRYKRQESGT
ncbi:MAG TPA: AMP-binding protein [Blastocatellia bacterium]|nr:AMP-binding protein [Blastocatellia bacterium]